MQKKTFLKSALGILTLMVLMVSCDKDFNSIGSSLIGDPHFGYELYSDASVNAFNMATGAVQTNNLPLNSLGIYNNPVFGKTKAGFVTQLEMSSVNPDFDKDGLFVDLDSVVLSVPYFSHKDPDSETGYALDSIIGSGTIDLKLFESGYYIAEHDPSTNFEDSQKFYSDQESVFDGKKVNFQLNNSSDTKENSKFEPSAKPFITYKRNDDLTFKEKTSSNIESSKSPRMALHLDVPYFKNKIINAPTGKLYNNSVFKDYFRGLYFQVADADTGKLMKLDFSKGDVTLHYRTYDNDQKKKQVLKTFVLKMTGNTVNLLQQTNSADYANAIAPRTMPPIPNDNRLHIKGGEGSVAIIDLFGPDNDNDGIADELETMRKENWLINEANLTFYIDKEKMSGTPEPQRVFLYDMNNRRPLYDYTTDATTYSNTKYNKSIHGGLILTENGRGLNYKVRITNHIRNLIQYPDSTNVRLGLVVTESIGQVGNSKLKQPVDVPYPFKSKNARAFDRVPAASVMNPLGTILYGSTDQGSDEENKKRLKLEIYYTKPN